MILTDCKFFYGWEVTPTNKYIDFNEAGTDFVAILTEGVYSSAEFIAEISRAMNLAGAYDYTVSFDRSVRSISISGSSVFSIKPQTGANVAVSAFPLMGFTIDAGPASLISGSASGSEWVPQFKAQSFVDFEDNQSAVDGSVKQAANGTIQAFRFGTKKIMECNFKFVTNVYQSAGNPIANNQSGVSDCRNFLIYATKKAPLEFMPDKNSPSSFSVCVLESTDVDSMGLGFKLKEMFSQGLVGYFETGLLKFRKVS